MEDVTIFSSDFTLLIAGVLLLLVILLITLVRRRAKKQSLSRKLEKILKTITKDEVSSVILPDGIGGLIEVERMLLTEHGIVVIQTYPLIGHLYGSDHIDQWTQIIDGRSFKFTNPNRHISDVKHAVQLLAPKIPVFSRIIFSAEGNFPKGIPHGVSVLSTLEQDLQEVLKSPNIATQCQSAWDKILRIARKDGQAVNRGNVDP